jgi:hypothetical protein
MYRLGHLVDNEWQRYSHPPVFTRGERIVAGVPNSDPVVFLAALACLAPPYQLLYILHTPRGEGAEGRYQSPPLALSDVEKFLAKFSPFLSADGRYDLWGHSTSDGGTVVWDRHDKLFAYGPLDRIASALIALGFTEGSPPVPAPHEHHYRPECDALANELLSAFDWTFSPLRSEDEQ